MSDRWESLLSRPPIRPDWMRLREALAGTRVLVTGSGGSVGQTLVAALAEANVDSLTLVETHEPSLYHQRQALAQAHPEIPCRCVLADVRDQRKMAAVFADARPDLVFHLAAYKQVPLAEENVDQVIAVNVFAALDLARLATEMGVSCFLYPSTDKAVRPPSIYGATKRLVELGLRALSTAPPADSDHGASRSTNHTALRSVRLVNVIGSQGSVVDLFRRQIAAGRPLTLTDPAHTRYWITVDEATYLLLQVACASDLGSGPFFLDAGPAVPMGEFVRQAIAILAPGATPQIQIIGPRPGERQHEELAYPFETPRPTTYPGILEVVDSRDRDAGGRGATAVLWDRIERLRQACEQTGVAELRRALFAVVEEEAVWSHT